MWLPLAIITVFNVTHCHDVTNLFNIHIGCWSNIYYPCWKQLLIFSGIFVFYLINIKRYVTFCQFNENFLKKLIFLLFIDLKVLNSGVYQSHLCLKSGETSITAEKMWILFWIFVNLADKVYKEKRNSFYK